MCENNSHLSVGQATKTLAIEGRLCGANRSDSLIRACEGIHVTMRFSVPFLAQLSEPARDGPKMPTLTTGRDGLLWRKGAGLPFLEELIAEGATKRPALSTLLTKQAEDVPDPDVIRAAPRMECSLVESILGTLETRLPLEAPDPDVIRTVASWALTTSFTNGRVDRPDPDTIRH